MYHLKWFNFQIQHFYFIYIDYLRNSKVDVKWFFRSLNRYLYNFLDITMIRFWTLTKICRRHVFRSNILEIFTMIINNPSPIHNIIYVFWHTHKTIVFSVFKLPYLFILCVCCVCRKRDSVFSDSMRSS